MFYLLDGHDVVACKDPIEFAHKYFKQERVVATTALTQDVTLSTVFIGTDKRLESYGNETVGRPLVFETALLINKQVEERVWLPTWEEAAAFHNAIVTRLDGIYTEIDKKIAARDMLLEHGGCKEEDNFE